MSNIKPAILIDTYGENAPDAASARASAKVHKQRKMLDARPSPATTASGADANVPQTQPS
jgi:hypothetical protein